MTNEGSMDELHTALRRYAEDHGLAAAYALILNSATDADLARLSEPLHDLRNSSGKRVGAGPAVRVEILRAVGSRLTRDGHREPYTAINYYDPGADHADSSK